MYKLLTGCSMLLLATSASAISNIESERPNLPEQGLDASVKLGLDGKTGNDEEKDYAASAKLVYRRNDEILLFIVDQEYGSTRNIKDTDNAFLHGRWTHIITPLWSAEAFAQWEQDEFDNLKSRVLLGGGGRYLLWQKQDVYSFTLGLGAFHEEETQDLVSYQQTDSFWRMNAFYTYKYQMNKMVSFINTTYIQPRIGDSSDLRALSDFGLKVGITDSLAITIAYKVTYDSEPAQNFDIDPPIDNYKTNTEYQTSLQYTF